MCVAPITLPRGEGESTAPLESSVYIVVGAPGGVIFTIARWVVVIPPFWILAAPAGQ
jgi:hypothetical protein